MAGGPYRGNNGWLSTKWSRNGVKKTEALKTKNMTEAQQRLSTLETLFNNRFHRPWEIPWYDNPQIKHIVYSGYLDLDALRNGVLSGESLTLWKGAELYKTFKKSQKGRKGWKSKRTIRTHSQTIDKFVEYTGSNKLISTLTEDDLNAFYQRPEFKSDFTKVAARARINGMLRYFVDNNYLPVNIDAEVDPPQTEIKRYIRKETLLAVFGRMEELQSEDNGTFSFDTTWYADFCRMSYDTGLRGVEQIQLQVHDITPSDIIVGNSFRVKTNFQRKVDIGNGIARKVIDKYIDPEFRSQDVILRKNMYLFGRGSEKTRARISSALKEASLKFIPGGITLQDLRHISAMKWLMENKDTDEGFRLLLLMQRLGHKQLTTTQGYLNFLPSDGVI